MSAVQPRQPQIARARVPLPVCPKKPAPYDGPSRDEILALRGEYLNPGIFHLYRNPICIVQGNMQYLWDDAGRQYLDAFGGIVTVSVGHCHPKLTARIQEQAARLCHATTLYLHPNIALFAKGLADRMPAESNLKVSYFTNSGSEANELAVLMARLKTGREEILTLRNCYHGGTAGAMTLTAISSWKYPVAGALTVRHVPPGYCYRCPFGLTYPSCDLRCARSAEDAIRYETSGDVACFIAEPVQGVGGVVVPPREYFQIVYEIVRKAGGLCIADEVQTGFGRTGTHYWGHENFGVKPDFVTMAKGIGNGAALGACTTRPDIAAEMKRRLHFNTFGGNPMAMIQGLTVLEIIDEDRTQQNAREVGGYLQERLLALQEKHALIGDVRGMGLLLGVELVRDRETKEPALAETTDLLEMTKDRGLLIGKGGLFGNVLRITPPMCVTTSDCDFLADCLDECLEEIEAAT